MKGQARDLRAFDGVRWVEIHGSRVCRSRRLLPVDLRPARPALGDRGELVVSDVTVIHLHARADAERLAGRRANHLAGKFDVNDDC